MSSNNEIESKKCQIFKLFKKKKKLLESEYDSD